MAQTDLVLIVAKADLRQATYHGTVQVDTLVRVRATLCRTVEGPA